MEPSKKKSRKGDGPVRNAGNRLVEPRVGSFIGPLSEDHPAMMQMFGTPAPKTAQHLLPSRFLQISDMAHLEQQSMCLMTRLYDLFYKAPGRWPVRVVTKEVKDEKGFYGSRYEAQQCHWYENRGTFLGQPSREETRCTKEATMYPFFCIEHAALVYDKLRIKPSVIANAGLGLFAQSPPARAENTVADEVVFEADSPITQYHGDYLSVDPFDIDQSKRSYIYLFNSPTWTALFNLRLPYYVDATGTQSSMGRYANHAPTSSPRAGYTGPLANAKVMPLFAITEKINELKPDFSRCGDSLVVLPWLVATRDIKHGEEIFIDYGPSYYFEDGGESTTVFSATPSPSSANTTTSSSIDQVESLSKNLCDWATIKFA